MNSTVEPPKIGEGVEGSSEGGTNEGSSFVSASALMTTERRILMAIAGFGLRCKDFLRAEAWPMAGFAAIDAHFMLAMMSKAPGP